MLYVCFKSLKFLILLSSCVPLIHGFHKRASAAGKSEEDGPEISEYTNSTSKEQEEKNEAKLLMEEVLLEKMKEKINEEEGKIAEEIEKSYVPEVTAEEDNSTTLKTISEETTTSASPTPSTELSIERSPEGVYAVSNTEGKICLLARFEADFLITYPSKGGEEKADVKVNKTGEAKGKCEHTTKTPLLQISWQKYAFTLKFNKTGEDTWIVSSMELTYDTSDTLFDRATNPGKKTARSQSLSLFETPLSKSFYCPGEEVVKMYVNNKHVVTARLKDIYLQPYGVEEGQFSPAQRCNKVVIDETPYVQDETVPLAVGCTLALITLLVLLGFSFHRAYNAAKVDYNTMG